MPAPPRSVPTVTDAAIRWQASALDSAGWAIDGEIALVRHFRRSKTTEWEWIARPVDGAGDGLPMQRSNSSTLS